MLCHTHTTSHCMTKWFFYAESLTGHLQPSHILCLGSGHLVSDPGEEESLKKYFLLRRDGRRRPCQKYDISIPDDQVRSEIGKHTLVLTIHTSSAWPGSCVMIVSTRSWVATSRQIRSFSQIDRETNEEMFRHPPSLVCLVCSYCIDNVPPQSALSHLISPPQNG